ncbi:MAG: REP-associated tyrosine transposase [Phycisphaerales bacterium]
MERAPLIRKMMKRWERPADSRFLTFSCYQRLPLFRNARICDRFIERLNDARYRLGFQLYAYVVMPEHVHLLLSVDREGPRVPAILKDLKGGFSLEVLSARRKLKAPVLSRITPPGQRPRFWQHGGGFDRNITTSEKFWEKLRYIHNNPVARGLVTEPAAWRWSSASLVHGR